MFDLTGDLPTDFAGLRDALERSVRRRIELAEPDVVSLHGSDWPTGERLAVVTTGGLIRVDPARGALPEHLKPPRIVGDRVPGPRFKTLSVESKPLTVDVEGGGRLPMEVDVQGSQMVFEFGTDAKGTWVMAPAAGVATAELSVDRDTLLDVVRSVAIAQAARQGVSLTRVTADVTSPDPRRLRVFGTVAGSKKVAFFDASFTVHFEADLLAEPDEAGELVGRIEDVRLGGEGPVMKVLLGLIKPLVERFKRTPLPLRDLLATAGVQGLGVRDVEVEAGPTLRLRADFGSA
jgi:hypothetical protein